MGWITEFCQSKKIGDYMIVKAIQLEHPIPLLLQLIYQSHTLIMIQYTLTLISNKSGGLK